jgi:hypothetical protein
MGVDEKTCHPSRQQFLTRNQNQNKNMKTPQFNSLQALAIGMFGIAATAQAELITTIPDLPPLGGIYLSTDVHQIFGGPALQFILSLPEHAPIAAEAQRRPGGHAGLPGTPADEIESFPSVLNFQGEVIQNGISLGIFPLTATGPVETMVVGKIGNVTGTFDTEMLSMNLSGISPLGPFMIRESPTLPSTGVTSITDIGGGLYRIDSFFDVFTELSIDGGGTWMPSNNGAGHVTLVPEPTSMSLLAFGVLGAVGFVRRRR